MVGNLVSRSMPIVHHVTELQQPDRQVDRQADRQAKRWAVVLAIVQMAGILGCLTYETLLSRQHTPYHTSALSGEAWVQELLSGHPEHIWNELSVYQGTFVILVKAFQMLGIQLSCHVSIEEQLSIFLYTVVTGLSCIHVGEHFQQTPSTITKWVFTISFQCL